MDVDAPVQNDKSSDQISTNNNEKKSSIIIGRGEEKIKSNLTVCNGGPVAKSDMGPNPGLLTMKKEPDDQTDVQNGTSLHPVSKIFLVSTRGS